FCHADLVRKRITLAAEAASHRSRDDPDAACGKSENLGKGAVEIVRCLRGRPYRELVVRPVEAHGAVLLYRQVRIALIKEGAFENVVRTSEAVFDVAEFEGHRLLNIGMPVPRVDPLALV